MALCFLFGCSFLLIDYHYWLYYAFSKHEIRNLNLSIHLAFCFQTQLKFLKSDWKNTFSRIFSNQNADENHLSIMGKEVLDTIFVEFGNKTPNELIDLSHEFHAWKKHSITNSDNLSAQLRNRTKKKEPLLRVENLTTQF